MAKIKRETSQVKLRVRKLVNFFAGYTRFIGLEGWKLRDWLSLPPNSLVEDAIRRIGRKKLRKAYVDNLKRVLRSATELSSQLPGNTVITSDHGELLGEKKLGVGHPPHFESTILTEVPWFEVEETK